MSSSGTDTEVSPTPEIDRVRGRPRRSRRRLTVCHPRRPPRKCRRRARHRVSSTPESSDCGARPLRTIQHERVTVGVDRPRKTTTSDTTRWQSFATRIAGVDRTVHGPRRSVIGKDVHCRRPQHRNLNVAHEMEWSLYPGSIESPDDHERTVEAKTVASKVAVPTVCNRFEETQETVAE